MEDINNKLLTKRNIIALLLFLIVVLAIPVGVKLVQQQQQLRSKAKGEGPITFVGGNVGMSGTAQTTSSLTVNVELRDPWNLP